MRVSVLLPFVELGLRVVESLALILVGFASFCGLTPTNSIYVDAIDWIAEFVARPDIAEHLAVQLEVVPELGAKNRGCFAVHHKVGAILDTAIHDPCPVKLHRVNVKGAFECCYVGVKLRFTER